VSGPIIVTAIFGDGDNGWLQQLRREYYPPDRNQVPAHLTLFHHLPPGIEPELKRRLATLTAFPQPRAMIASVLDLGGGTALGVHSEDLVDLREGLAEDLHGLLTPQDQAAWRPHITIQNKVEPREAKALQQRMRAGFEARPLEIRGLATWHYLGGPWQPIRDYIFRG
jgi:hypothetical protein